MVYDLNRFPRILKLPSKTLFPYTPFQKKNIVFDEAGKLEHFCSVQWTNRASTVTERDYN